MGHREWNVGMGNGMFSLEPPNKGHCGTSNFRDDNYVQWPFCSLFQRGFPIECVYISTFGLSFVGRFILFFIGGFTV